jgi:hypothetical protein
MAEGAEHHAGFRLPVSIVAVGLLLLQIVVGAIIFVAIGAVAVILNLVTMWLENGNRAPQWFALGMTALEMFLWAADSLCFVLFVVVEVRNFAKRVWLQRV